MSHHQNAEQNRNIKRTNKSLKNVTKVHILGNHSNKSNLHSWRN